MPKTAAIFSGQGSQYPGMGKKLYENFSVVREIYGIAGDILGYDLKKLSFYGGEDELSSTINAQPAIFAISLSAYAAAREQLPGFEPVCVLGHSLGEYAALCCAGAFKVSDGFRIIKARAKAMNTAASEADCAMYAIMGSDVEAVKNACEKSGGFVVPVNFNQPAQTVISGEAKAAKNAAEALGQSGAKTVKLSVSGAFHTKLMQSAADIFKAEISDINFNNAKIPFYSNLTGNLLEIENYPDYFARHMVSPVLFSDEINSMAQSGVEICAEFGPKRTAATLAKKNAKALSVFGVEDMASLEKFAAALA